MAFWGKKKKAKDEHDPEVEVQEPEAADSDATESEPPPAGHEADAVEPDSLEAAPQPEPEADPEPEPETEPGLDAELSSESEEAEPEAIAPEPEAKPKKLGFWARRRQRLAAEVSADEQEEAQPEAPEAIEPTETITEPEPLEAETAAEEPAAEIESGQSAGSLPDEEGEAEEAQIEAEPEPATEPAELEATDSEKSVEPEAEPAELEQKDQEEPAGPDAEPEPEEEKLGFWARRRKKKQEAAAEVRTEEDGAQPETGHEEAEQEPAESVEEPFEPDQAGEAPLETPEKPDAQPEAEHEPEAEIAESGPAEEAEPQEEEQSGERPAEQLETEAEETEGGIEAPASDEETGVEPSGDQSESEEPKGLFSRIFQRLGKTRSKIGGSIERITLGKKIDDEVLDELEEVLVTADLGMETAISLIDGLRGQVRRKELNDAQALKEALKSGIQAALAKAPAPAPRENKPHVILMVGVNGVGKTTTIGKLASHFSGQGQKVLLAAADTFRAAAAEQLGIWAERTGSLFVRQKEGADPSSVAYSAVESALSKEVDLVLVDTAGRLHTKVNLMEELKKIHRVIGKIYPGAPHEVLLVLDATTGQNALSQAKMFNQSVPLSGVVLTKLDGTAKGGIVVAISSELQLPVCFVGLGEGVDDLRPFDPEEFADALF